MRHPCGPLGKEMRVVLSALVFFAPVWATLGDVTGLVIYFSVATVILRGTLL